MDLKITAPKGFRIDCAHGNKLYSFQDQEMWEFDSETQICIKVTCQLHSFPRVFWHPLKMIYSEFNNSLYILNGYYLAQYSLVSKRLVSVIPTTVPLYFLYQNWQPIITFHSNPTYFDFISRLLLPELSVMVCEYLSQLHIEGMNRVLKVFENESIIAENTICDQDDDDIDLVTLNIKRHFNSILIDCSGNTTLIENIMNVYVDKNRVWYQDIKDGSIKYFDF